MKASRVSQRIGWLAAALALALLTVAVYLPGLRGPFLLDDFDSIYILAANEASGMSWADVLRTAPDHIRARWVSNLSFLLTQAASGSAYPPSAFAYKLGNLLLHLACAAASAWLALRLAQRWGAEPRRARQVAWLTAALFALHPLLLSTVLYPVQRMAQLPTLFALLAGVIYLHWRANFERAGVLRNALAIGALLACIGLAVLAKENGVLIPLLIGALELTAFRWPAREAAGRAWFDAGFGLTCAAPLVLGGVLLVLRFERVVAGYAARDFTLGERVLTQLHVLGDYLGQIAWPRLGRMGLYYDDFAVIHSLDAVTLLLALLYAGALALAVALRRRWPAFALATLWFFAAHALESTIVPLELVFEHRNYLALFGPALAVAWGLTRLPPRLGGAVALAVLALLALQTWRRAHEWSSYERWIGSEVAHHPDSLRAHTDWLMYNLTPARGAAAQAAAEALQQRFPDHAQSALLGLAPRCLASAPAPLPAAALDQIRRGAIGKDAFHAFVGLRERKRRGECAGLDWRDFATVAATIADNPHLAGDAAALAAWHRLHAQAAAEAGDWPTVATALDAALAQQADDPRDWLLLMRAHLARGDALGYDLARTRFLRLVMGNPGNLQPELQRLDAARPRLDSAATERQP